MKLSVSEVFYSIQGEGKTTGYPAVFLRLGGCNLMCGGQGTQHDGELYDATWRCDTIEVWMKSQGIEFENIFDNECHTALDEGAHLVITGGEPLLQTTALEKFVTYLDSRYHKIYIEVETNGTIRPSEILASRINQWNVSPKLSNSGNNISICFNEDALNKFNKLNSIFKFVISNVEDWNEILDTYYAYINDDKIWLMPSGENQELLNETKQLVAELCKNNFLKMSNRLHIEIWNKKTGV
jgi:organic radical activating enzyme